MSSSKTILGLLLVLILCSTLENSFVTCLEYEVGESKGWVVPLSNESSIYNKWASKERFQIEDTIRFKYEKDSVMLVTDMEYKECNSTHPIFFSNNGNTIFKFDRSGFFYFISGVSGHCQRGQKMIIKVMASEDNSPPSTDDNPSGSNGGVDLVTSSTHVSVILVSGFVGSFLL